MFVHGVSAKIRSPVRPRRSASRLILVAVCLLRVTRESCNLRISGSIILFSRFISRFLDASLHPIMISRHGSLPSDRFSFFPFHLSPLPLIARSNDKYSARYFPKTTLEIIAAVVAELADFPLRRYSIVVQFIRSAHFGSDALPLSTHSTAELADTSGAVLPWVRGDIQSSDISARPIALVSRRVCFKWRTRRIPPL